jgi:hypothetical protein
LQKSCAGYNALKMREKCVVPALRDLPPVPTTLA